MTILSPTESVQAETETETQTKTATRTFTRKHLNAVTKVCRYEDLLKPSLFNVSLELEQKLEQEPKQDQKQQLNSPAASRLPHAVIINGPNLNLLGSRQPQHYGTETLVDVEIFHYYLNAVSEQKINLTMGQFDHLGNLALNLEKRLPAGVKHLAANPAVWGHCAGPELQAVLQAHGLSVDQVHISNVFARERFRWDTPFNHYSQSTVTGGGLLGCYGFLVSLWLEALARTKHALVPFKDTRAPYEPVFTKFAEEAQAQFGLVAQQAHASLQATAATNPAQSAQALTTNQTTIQPTPTSTREEPAQNHPTEKAVPGFTDRHDKYVFVHLRLPGATTQLFDFSHLKLTGVSHRTSPVTWTGRRYAVDSDLVDFGVVLDGEAYPYGFSKLAQVLDIRPVLTQHQLKLRGFKLGDFGLENLVQTQVASLSTQQVHQLEGKQASDFASTKPLELIGTGLRQFSSHYLLSLELADLGGETRWRTVVNRLVHDYASYSLRTGVKFVYLVDGVLSTQDQYFLRDAFTSVDAELWLVKAGHGLDYLADVAKSVIVTEAAALATATDDLDQTQAETATNQSLDLYKPNLILNSLILARILKTGLIPDYTIKLD